MQSQVILTSEENYNGLTRYLTNLACHKMLLVCGNSLDQLNLGRYFKTISSRISTLVVRFSEFTSNPTYDQVVAGVEVFHREECDAIVAVGGGSALDVAKCIKLFSTMDKRINYLEQKIEANDIPLIAVPTTAGTGSETTKFAVIYYNGEKKSVNHESCIPGAVLFDPSCLKTLPDYQRRATMLDALCHATESYWSVNSTEQSIEYADHAIRVIIQNIDGYLANLEDANMEMLMAANLAGKAINISQTTAGHAMCYKLTSLYGIAHGHAAALCVSKLMPFMVESIENGVCADHRGVSHLRAIFEKLAEAYGYRKIDDTDDDWIVKAKWLCETFSELIYNKLKMETPSASISDYKILRSSVNPERLANNPIPLTGNQIENLYKIILRR